MWTQACLLAFLAGAQPFQEAAPASTPAQVVLMGGRAELVPGSGRPLALQANRPQLVHDWGYLEVAAASQVRLSWAGIGGVVFEGPAIVEWGSHLPGWSGVNLAFHELAGGAQVELRQGGLDLDLPGAWSLEASRGAFFVRERSSGDIELDHHGGEPITVRSLIPRKGVSQEGFALEGGSSVRLRGSVPTVVRRPQAGEPTGLQRVHIESADLSLSRTVTLDDLIGRRVDVRSRSPRSPRPAPEPAQPAARPSRRAFPTTTGPYDPPSGG